MPAPLLRPAPALVTNGVLAFVPVGVGAHPALENVPPAERELVSTMSATRRDGFVAGRQALRAALGAVDPRLVTEPLLRTPRGAPLLPAGVSGSVSHKRSRAVALAAPWRDAAGQDEHVGVDLEQRPARIVDEGRDRSGALARRILTPRELDGLASLDAAGQREATLLCFALKEAIYKAIDPFVERYVRFTEVEIDLGERLSGPVPEGFGDVRLLLPECERTPMSARVAWRLEPEWIVAVAVARRG